MHRRRPYTYETISQNRPKDYGPNPFVINIEKATLQNNNFRTSLWTGTHLQLTLMSIKPGEDIGQENHPNLDQFLRIEQGQGVVMMGDNRENLNYRQRVSDNFAIIIPAGKWHNLINTGRVPLKLYSIYAPPTAPLWYSSCYKTGCRASRVNAFIIASVLISLE